MLTEQQHADYSEVGYFIIPKFFSPDEIRAMRSRIEELIQGKHFKKGRRFQSYGSADDYGSKGPTPMNYEGPDVSYRKISDLEYDEVYLRIIQKNQLNAICSELVDETVSIMRITMMDKPAGGGTHLPWHQDVSVDWPTTTQPQLTLWFPLDRATAASGSIQVIPGSHKNGVIDRGHTLPIDLETQYAPEQKTVTVEVEQGDCLFFHPALLHRSGINKTDQPRRAINVILMPGQVIHTKRNKPYPILFGSEGILRPDEVARLDAIPV